MRRVIVRFSVSIVLSLSAVGAAQTVQCDPPALVAEIIKALPTGSARHAALGDLIRAGKGDFWVSEAFLGGSVYERKPIRDLYRQRFESHPEPQR